MNKKRILIYALCILAGMGCENTASPPMYEAFKHPVFKQDVPNAGELHNKIAMAYAEKLWAAYDDRPITRKEFVKLVVDATNEVFTAEGIPPIVTARDINSTVDEITNLRHRKVFDFFSYDPGDPKAIVNDWERRGIVSREDARAVRARLDNEPDAYSTPRSKAIQVFDSVYSGSMQLWKNPNFNIKRVGPLTTDGPPPTKEQLKWNMDSIFVLLGMLLSGGTGGTVSGLVASLAIEMIPPADLGSWDCSDYCNMG